MGYDECMKRLAIIAVIIITFAQPLAAQETPEVPIPRIIFGLIEVYGHLVAAGQLMEKHCPEAPPISTEYLTHKNVKEKAAKYIKYCKRQLKQKGANTKSTVALALLFEKIVAFQNGPDQFTEEDLRLLVMAFGSHFLFPPEPVFERENKPLIKP